MLSQLFAASEYPSLVRILSMKCLNAIFCCIHGRTYKSGKSSSISFMMELLIVRLLAYHLIDVCLCFAPFYLYHSIRPTCQLFLVGKIKILRK